MDCFVIVLDMLQHIHRKNIFGAGLGQIVDGGQTIKTMIS